MGRLSAQVYERTTTTKLGAGPIYNVLRAKLTRAIDRIGEFSFEIPADDRQYALLTQGREVWLFHEGETNPIWRGIVDSRLWKVAPDGSGVLSIAGLSLAVELQWESTYMGIIVDDETAGDAVDLVLASTSWTNTVSGASLVNVTNRFDNMTLWEALRMVAQSQDGYLRETATARDLEVKQATTDSGIRLTNLGVESAGPFLRENSALGIVEGLPTVREDGAGIVNRIVPLGLDEGNVIYDLGRSTRVSPYTIASFTKNRPSIVSVNTFDVAVPGAADTGANEWLTVEAGTVQASGPNRCVVIFHSWSGGIYRVADWRPTVNGVQVEQITRTGTANRDHSVSILKNAPAGDLRIALEVWDTDSAGDHKLIVIVCQDVDQVLAITGAQADGTGTAAAVSLAATAGDLRLACVCSTTSFTDPTSASPQVRLVTSLSTPHMVVDSMADDSDGAFGWTMAVSEVWNATAVQLLGSVTYYIEDSTSVTAYGRRVRHMIQNANKVVGADSTQLANAANTLYDLAAAALDRNKDPVTFYTVSVAHLPEPATWLVGDSMTLRYRGRAQTVDGDLTWLDVNATVKVIEATEEWGEDGARRWTLLLSTVYRFPRTGDEVLGENLAKIFALEGVR